MLLIAWMDASVVQLHFNLFIKPETVLLTDSLHISTVQKNNVGAKRCTHSQFFLFTIRVVCLIWRSSVVL